MKKEIMFCVFLIFSLIMLASGVYVQHFLKEDFMGGGLFLLGVLSLMSISYLYEKDEK